MQNPLLSDIDVFLNPTHIGNWGTNFHIIV